MTDSVVDTRPAAPVLLTYRPWRGQLQGPAWSIWAIARTSLATIVRRKIFWSLFGLAAMIFAFFFYGQYLHSWLTMQLADQPIRMPGVRQPIPAVDLIKILRNTLHLDGSGHLFRNFIWFEGHVVMIVLALAGAILIGNDFQHGALPFYLSKPLGRWHYIAGKWLAVGVCINLMTALPALLLFIEYGMLESWNYYYEQIGLLIGALAYCQLLTIVLGLLLLATAVWLRRTVPLVMVWAAIFVFLRMLGDMMVRFDPRWRLLDLWNNLYLLGSWCLQMPRDTLAPSNQPSNGEAAAVLAAVCLACVVYLNRRIQAVEIV